MGKTTIELPESTKQRLRDARLEHETNYGQTIDRLLGENPADYVTATEAREIAREEIRDTVVMEALE